MRRLPSLLFALLLAAPGALDAQASASEAQIRNALSAAPQSLAEGATVALTDGTVLREGSNGWICFPDVPAIPNNAPMCLDAPWLETIDALQNQRAPDIDVMGFGYMLQGDMPVSNVDPFAEGPTPDNEWIAAGPPHIMIIFPDPESLEGLSTDPHNGGPWVMWKGTPWAHVMVPTVPRRN